MLVLSRKIGEGVRMPQVGISVKVLDRNGGRVKIGIEAPDDIEIVRDEIVDEAPRTAAAPGDDDGITRRLAELAKKSSEIRERSRKTRADARVAIEQARVKRIRVTASLDQLKAAYEEACRTTRAGQEDTQPHEFDVRVESLEVLAAEDV